MEKFLNLPVEKQKVVIDAALGVFGTNGYKKASISDIANAAGISKAMIFHYFGTKKVLYLCLVNLCTGIVMSEVDKQFDNTVTDFFDRIMLATKIEMAVMKKHPSIPSFLTSMYFENDEAVKEDIKVILVQSENFRNKIAFDGMDTSKFKDGVDPKLILKMLTLMADGFTSQLSNHADVDFDRVFEEFEAYMNLLKNNLYKEGSLK